MPMIKVSDRCWSSDPNPTEAEQIVNALISYSDDLPVHSWMDHHTIDYSPEGFPPLFINRWYDDSTLLNSI